MIFSLVISLVFEIDNGDLVFLPEEIVSPNAASDVYKDRLT